MKFRCYVGDMYPNRFHRTTPKRNQTITPNSHPQFFIRRSEIAFDKRVKYIEQVCQVLIESRFGACLAEPVTIDLSNTPELEPVLFSDLFDEDGLLPGHALSLPSTQGRIPHCGGLISGNFSGTHVSEPGAVATGFLNPSFSGTHNQTTALPPNQGRGSP